MKPLKEQIERALPNIKVEVIYHGVNPSIFKPLPENEKKHLRRKYGLEGKFVIGCVARNQPRKQIPALIKAFSELLRKRENVALYLHMSPYDEEGWNIPELLERYHVTEATRLTEKITPEKGLPDIELNRIYNLFDVMALSTAGEGFGLPIVESMAAGVPVIATGYSACVELIQGRGELIDVKAYVTGGHNTIEHAIIDVDSLVEKLELLYENAGLREEYSHKSREFAIQLDWDKIVNQWDALLKDL